jgi:diguanylate cyclase (GGDEF)-like protein/PAS domain S-box-containing protein
MPPTQRVSSVADALSEALRASESRYRRLFETAQDGILLLNADTAQIEDVNPYLIDLLGYSRAEFLGKKLWEVGAFADRAEIKDLFAALQTTGYVRYEDLPLKTKAGARIEVEFVSNAYDSVGIKLIQCNIRDITERKKAEQALRTSEERLKTVFVQAPLGIALIDSLTGHIYESNPRFAEIAGRSMEEMVNIDWLQITHPDDVQADLDNMALLNTGKINRFQMEKRYLHPDGTAVWISMTIAPSKVEDKAHPRHLCMIQDITERKAAEGTIVHLNRVYAVLSGINSLIVRALNCDELFREACRIAVEAGGFRMAMIGIVDRSTMKVVPMASTGKDEALLTDIKCLLSSSEDAPKSMVAQVIREKKAVVSNDSLSDSRVLFGQKYAESGVRSMAVLPLIVADEAVGVLALYSSEIEFFQKEELKLLTELAGDIAFAIDHIGKQERLNYLAYYDALTGLANRSLFLERVAQYMRSAVSGGHKLALFLLDLERFKNINDSLGRPAGDALLKQVAAWLTYSTGDANLLARIDADHFALVIPEVRQDGDLARLAEKTMETFLEHPFHLNDAVFRIAAKVGIALFPDDAADADTLFRNAEAALKKAKASGDRCLFYTQKMTAAVARKLTLENQLRQALDNEEFALYYQPKVNLVSGKITSAEALIRWNDPRTGLVPPGKFIPILEETGLIYEVGRWALRKAIEDYLRWRSAGLTAVRIAVNVSPLQLRNRGFIAEIEQVIGIDAHAAAGLELEITESLIMEDVNHSIVSLQAIRAMGITIAIDDFGTGFSSLSYLAKLPVDTLKIDRSFVIDMTAGPEGLALVSTIIDLAHSLKLKVVAEGVETEEQSRLLRLLSCDEMQGFLFSKPLPSEIFETRFLALVPPGDA